MVRLGNTFFYLEPLYFNSDQEGKYTQREENTLLIVNIVKRLRGEWNTPYVFLCNVDNKWTGVPHNEMGGAKSLSARAYKVEPSMQYV